VSVSSLIPHVILTLDQMECALFLWRFGENPIKDEKGNKRKNVPQFNESDWGSKTRGWTESASRLAPEDWAYIFKEANRRAGLNGLVDDEDTVEYLDPRATIELWYVFFITSARHIGLIRFGHRTIIVKNHTKAHLCRKGS
jgi:hypothetical protein